MRLMTPASLWPQIGKRPGLGIAVGLALIILLGLGTWQLARLQWKTALIADLAHAETLAPIRFEEALALGKGAAWRRVDHIDCTLSPDRIVYVHAIKDGDAAYHLVTVCPVAGAASLIVDLGVAETRPLPFAPLEVRLSGRLRPIEAANAFSAPNDLKTDDWYTRTPADLSKRFGQTVRGDYFLVSDLKRSELAVSGLTQGPITAELPNNHLEYALTWYGLALVMLGFYGVMISPKRAPKAET
jgi:surfeit locus 1 family protein